RIPVGQLAGHRKLGFAHSANKLPGSKPGAKRPPRVQVCLEPLSYLGGIHAGGSHHRGGVEHWVELWARGPFSRPRQAVEALWSLGVDLEITFLGIGAADAYHTFSSTSLLLRFGQETMLVDCGPDTPRRLLACGLSFSDITTIWITHRHLDHCGGVAAFMFG